MKGRRSSPHPLQVSSARTREATHGASEKYGWRLVSPTAHIPVVDIAALFDSGAAVSEITRTAASIDAACRDVGFFAITGHGVDSDLQDQLEAASHEFFQQPESAKEQLAMANAGAAWRGWFPVGGELTSGIPDRKEGIYFGTEHPLDHPRVLSSVPLHGANQFPTEPPTLGPLSSRGSERCVRSPTP